MQHFLAGVDAAFAGDFEKSVKEHKAERRAGFTRCARDLPRAGVWLVAPKKFRGACRRAAV
jgi:hypothetical protein